MGRTILIGFQLRPQQIATLLLIFHLLFIKSHRSRKCVPTSATMKAYNKRHVPKTCDGNITFKWWAVYALMSPKYYFRFCLVFLYIRKMSNGIVEEMASGRKDKVRQTADDSESVVRIPSRGYFVG